MSTESTDPVVRRIREAEDDKEARRIEVAALVETEKQPEDPDGDC